MTLSKEHLWRWPWFPGLRWAQHTTALARFMLSRRVKELGEGPAKRARWNLPGHRQGKERRSKAPLLLLVGQLGAGCSRVHRAACQ